MTENFWGGFGCGVAVSIVTFFLIWILKISWDEAVEKAAKRQREKRP